MDKSQYVGICEAVQDVPTIVYIVTGSNCHIVTSDIIQENMSL